MLRFLKAHNLDHTYGEIEEDVVIEATPAPALPPAPVAKAAPTVVIPPAKPSVLDDQVFIRLPTKHRVNKYDYFGIRRKPTVVVRNNNPNGHSYRYDMWMYISKMLGPNGKMKKDEFLRHYCEIKGVDYEVTDQTKNRARFAIVDRFSKLVAKGYLQGYRVEKLVHTV